MAKIEISPGRPWSDLYSRRQPAVRRGGGGGGGRSAIWHIRENMTSWDDSRNKRFSILSNGSVDKTIVRFFSTLLKGIVSVVTVYSVEFWQMVH